MTDSTDIADAHQRLRQALISARIGPHPDDPTMRGYGHLVFRSDLQILLDATRPETKLPDEEPQ